MSPTTQTAATQTAATQEESTTTHEESTTAHPPTHEEFTASTTSPAIATPTAVGPSANHISGKRGRSKAGQKTRRKSKQRKSERKSECESKKEINRRKKKESEAFICNLPIDVDTNHRAFPLSDHTNWLKHLKDEGFVVVQLLDARRTGDLVEQLYGDLGRIGTGITRNNTSSHQNANWPGIFSVGVFKDNTSGLAHSRFAWECRAAARPVFQHIWGTDELITAFDGVGLFRDWGKRELKTSKTKRLWPHVDQGNNIGSHFHCIQGFINLLPADEYTGGFVVARRSHLHHAELMQKQTKNSANYLPMDFSSPQIQAFMHKFPLEFVHATAGSIVLWDSRLVHSNTHAAKNKPRAPDPRTPNLLRAVAYVTLMPKSRQTNKDHDMRQRMFAEGAQTNHWSTDDGMRKVHMAYPRHRSFKTMRSAALTPTQIQNVPQYRALI